MGEIVALGAVGGVFAAFATILGYLLNSNHRDRRQYEEAVDRAEKRADAAEERVRAARQVADEARAARFAAEETASALRGELATLKGLRDRGSR